MAEDDTRTYPILRGPASASPILAHLHDWIDDPSARALSVRLGGIARAIWSLWAEWGGADPRFADHVPQPLTCAQIEDRLIELSGEVTWEKQWAQWSCLWRLGRGWDGTATP